jgi:hypothetical protein
MTTTKTLALDRVGGAQTDASVSTPTLWSTKLNVHLWDRTFLTEITNNNWEGEIKAYGDTVLINEVPDITAQRWVPGTPPRSQSAKYSQIPLYINKTAFFQIDFNDVEELQSSMKVQSDFTDSATKGMDKLMFEDVVQSVYSSAGNTFDLSSPTADETFQAFMYAKTLMQKEKIDTDNPQDLWAVIPPECEYLIGIGAQTKANEMGVAKSTVLTGKPDNIFAGIRCFTSNLLAVVTSKPQIIIGHKMAITWAMQMAKKIEVLRRQEEPGDRVRGYCLYGFEVVKPEALVCINFQLPTISFS